MRTTFVVAYCYCCWLIALLSQHQHNNDSNRASAVTTVNFAAEKETQICAFQHTHVTYGTHTYLHENACGCLCVYGSVTTFVSHQTTTATRIQRRFSLASRLLLPARHSHGDKPAEGRTEGHNWLPILCTSLSNNNNNNSNEMSLASSATNLSQCQQI